MGSWDELCLLCGIATSGGPLGLLHRIELDELARQIAAEVRAEGNIHIGADEDILSIVTAALASSLPSEDEERRLDYRPSWLPVGLGSRADLTQSTCVAIGYFDEDKEGQAPIRDGGRIPDGRNVEVRRVRDIVGGDFRIVVRSVEVDEQEAQDEEDDEDDFDGQEEREEFCDSACSVAEVIHPNNPNFWLCERCYQYLSAWLDRDRLPCRNVALGSGTEPMSLGGELYEIVNSRVQRRLDAKTGLLPCIDYDGIEGTLNQFQSRFAGARRGSRHIAEGMRAGLRGIALIHAIMRDFRCWMFMEPEGWPEPIDSHSYPVFASFTKARTDPTSIIHSLPVELLVLILRELPVDSLLSLSATCKALRALITDSAFMNHVFREALLHGSLRWILPATSDEVPRANEVATRWRRLSESAVSVADASEDQSPSPFADPQFPYVAFVHACCGSDTMRNRKRIWGLVKQFEGLWREYRLKGWEVDRFYPSSELRVSVDQGA